MPTLIHKPPRQQGKDSPAYDPFADPIPSLLVCNIGKTHRLILNKFSIVPNHSILATCNFAPQSHLLEEADLAAAHACVRAYQIPNAPQSTLFVYFNSGPESGASLPHRHLQLVPVACLRQDVNQPWILLADNPPRPPFPFTIFDAPISLETSPSQLHATYLDLYRRACVALGNPDETTATSGEARISYNLAMTSHSLVVCPRVQGDVDMPMPALPHGQRSRLFINGAVLAGTVLVKSEAEWDSLVRYPGLLKSSLEKIGVPAVDD